MDRNTAFLVGTFNDHPADTGLGTFLLDEGPDFQIFLEKIPVISFVGIPSAVPGPVDLKPHGNWVNFLTHKF